MAHFSVDVFVDNFLEHVAGRPMTGSFDGHANCFVESGDDKALLIDFNYDTEPLPGTIPAPLRRAVRACSRRRAPTTWASSRSAGSTGTSCCPGVPSRCPRTCPWPGSTNPDEEA